MGYNITTPPIGEGKEEEMEEGKRRKVVARLKSIEGHVRGVQRMVEEDVYCTEILKQTMAVQAAIDKVNSIILENHLHSCVTTAIRGEGAGERERVITELLDVFETQSRL
ncbi:MAG: metal-sensitive transcriptional regulator [Anaerolineae bacterium]